VQTTIIAKEDLSVEAASGFGKQRGGTVVVQFENPDGNAALKWIKLHHHRISRLPAE